MFVIFHVCSDHFEIEYFQQFIWSQSKMAVRKRKLIKSFLALKITDYFSVFPVIFQISASFSRSKMAVRNFKLIYWLKVPVLKDFFDQIVGNFQKIRSNNFWEIRYWQKFQVQQSDCYVLEHVQLELIVSYENRQFQSQIKLKIFTLTQFKPPEKFSQKLKSKMA